MGSKAAVLWTGGKDCCLALHEAHSLGYFVTALVTFVPEVNPGFLAHPLPLMALQAEALDLPHLQIVIGVPYKESYIKAITDLGSQHGIETLVTGDIDLINGAPNWIRECAEGTGVGVLTPLWQLPRGVILDKMLTSGLDVRMTCVKMPLLGVEWLGRKLDRAAVDELIELERGGVVDACGENGEFHTMVVDAPLFLKRIVVEGFSVGRLSMVSIRPAN
ncbi:hypothetical protein KFL_007590040 [Klebsormidium nitens]|uniref:Diphthine--ammonia ligase n=1 Tax=Klebsormidium nitens TaxID=105231 RepID=A0A1Y1IKB6_KLENI|nr:hypothetical protein KFL_007590040 [Klebsormidium nitens]|eukprot:GAQ91290.1 hypothetical protein KFL_007590040 [Klebsormidium nitens]